MKTGLSGSEIRKTFIDFFVSKGHTFVPSASLVPGEDQTLLFTNAGMVQFKEIFLGTDRRSYTRAVNSQKCMRVAGKHNDLDDVGRDDTHHTFFEMLGNWSFGDYYKKEAISWAWELLTEVWQIEPGKLWVTCFKDEKGQIPTDEEAFEYWKSQPGIIPSHILFSGRKDNLWEMAETGPCGPCSEIHFDLGPDRCDKKHVEGHVCSVNGDCRRFLEIWNLVFIQYNRSSETDFEPLPQKHVDTGMGFERIVSILQQKTSNYRTDLFMPILQGIQKMTGHTDDEMDKDITPYRVIADHIRSAVFLIADGVNPGNIGRNYVCRMIIRRAALFGSKIGLVEPFLYTLADIVVNRFGDAYPELVKNREIIIDQILREEKRFSRTVEVGLSHLSELLAQLKTQNETELTGQDAFELYATHGLPLEITRDISRENGFDVDVNGFRKAMENHRLISAAGKTFGSMGGDQAEFFSLILDRLIDAGKLEKAGVKYDPYSQMSTRVELLALVQDGEEKNFVKDGQQVTLIISDTPFYIESGGQVADQGFVVAENEDWVIQIETSHRPAAGVILLSGHVKSGTPKVGDRALAVVDEKRRRAVMRNHTATHLLHAALRKVLGEHARQAGSLVAPDYLRFDFTHPEPLTAEQIAQVEDLVNQEIYAEYELVTTIKNLDDAIGEGAMALFGEKYSENVRTVSIGGDERISYELCGGTHVKNTNQIGIFLVTSEGSVASGVRRIEAITGEGAYRVIRASLSLLNASAHYLNVGSEHVLEKIESLNDELELVKKQAQQLRQKLSAIEFNKALDATRVVKGISILATVLPSTDIDTLRLLTDQFKQIRSSGCVVLGSVVDSRPVLIAAVTDDLVARGLNAAELVRSIAREVGGGGGGKPTLAQAGGKDPDRLSAAIAQVEEFVSKNLRDQA